MELRTETLSLKQGDVLLVRLPKEAGILEHNRILEQARELRKAGGPLQNHPVVILQEGVGVEAAQVERVTELLRAQAR
jgi:uridine phosphorylase